MLLIYPKMYILFITTLIAVATANHQLDDIIKKLNNYEYITDDYIEHINKVQDSWTAGFNFPSGTKFSDLKVLAGTIRRKIPDIKYIGTDENVEIPKSFDSRTQWPMCKSIADIKNQGHCGSCWAVSSAITMSNRLCIASNGEFNTDISAQHITSCSAGYGCHGGWPLNAWKYFVKHGAPSGGDFNSKKGCQPYLVKPCINRTVSYGGDYNRFNEDGPEQCSKSDYVETPKCSHKCYNKKFHKKFMSDIHQGVYAYGVPNNVTEIQLNIMKYGPVVADFIVYQDFLTYKSGIYMHELEKIVGGHAIRILGWGEENDKPYWIVANQWGKEWGDNGIVKFLRGSNECGIEEDVISGIVKFF